MRAREIRGAHGGAQEPRGQQRLQWYERGETPPLTRRQREVLFLASHGLYNREIAAALGVSFLTVQTHWNHIFDRLDLHYRHSPRCMRAKAVAVALRKGYIS